MEVDRGGGPFDLLLALEQETRFTVRSGSWQRAVASGEEALQIADAMAHAIDTSRLLVLLATSTRPAVTRSCTRAARAGLGFAAEHGLEVLADTVGVVQGLLALGRGELEEAVNVLEQIARRSAEHGLFAVT